MDIEQAKDLKTSQYWETLVKEFEYRIGLLTQELLTCPPERLIALQTEVKVYKSLKNLPDQVINSQE